MTNQTTKDPMAQLDAAMNETFAELQRNGQGVSDSEVVRSQPPRRRAAPREEPVGDDGSWSQQEQQPRRQRRAARVQEPEGPDPVDAILQEAEPVEEPRRRARRSAGPERDEQGRFLPSRDTDAHDEDDADEFDEDDEDEAPARAGGRRYAETEEADVDDDDVESEGRTRAEDEDDEEQQPRQRGRRRFPRAVRDEIDRQVKEQVAKVVAENEQLREQQRALAATESESIGFLLKAVGTKEQREQLQATVNNPRLPIQQRNQAAAVLNRYLSNEQYARQYGQALQSLHRKEIVKRRQAGIDNLARYRVQLNPAIIQSDDESAMMVHIADQAIRAYRAQRQGRRAQQQRQEATRRGMADERSVRNGSFARDSLASSNGRRANGRVARTDPLRRAMANTRGVAANSVLPAPTDEVLQQLRNGEITFADLGFR